MIRNQIKIWSDYWRMTLVHQIILISRTVTQRLQFTVDLQVATYELLTEWVYLLCVYLQCGHLQSWNGITYEQTFQEETTTSEKWLLVVGAPARLPGSGSPCTDCRWRFISWRVLHSMEFGTLYNNNIVQDTVGVIWYLGVPSRVTSLCVNRLKIIKISISWESCLWYAVLHVAFIRFEVIADIYYSYFIEFTQQTCRKKVHDNEHKTDQW